jgi:hypothetical protein
MRSDEMMSIIIRPQIHMPVGQAHYANPDHWQTDRRMLCPGRSPEPYGCQIQRIDLDPKRITTRYQW